MVEGSAEVEKLQAALAQRAAEAAMLTDQLVQSQQFEPLARRHASADARATTTHSDRQRSNRVSSRPLLQLTPDKDLRLPLKR